MDQDERIEKVCALTILPYKDRGPKLKRVGTKRDYDSWYDWLINDWIVNQPDADQLMHLFILCDFQPVPFVTIVVRS